MEKMRFHPAIKPCPCLISYMTPQFNITVYQQFGHPDIQVLLCKEKAALTALSAGKSDAIAEHIYFPSTFSFLENRNMAAP